jgi:hypothetical protein
MHLAESSLYICLVRHDIHILFFTLYSRENDSAAQLLFFWSAFRDLTRRYFAPYRGIRVYSFAGKEGNYQLFQAAALLYFFVY